jgi:hypothetical protein
MQKLKTETIELICKIYEKYPTGGALHIVLDDDNVENHHIEWCLKEAIPNPEFCKPEDVEIMTKCAKNLLKLSSERQRLKCIWSAFEHMSFCGTKENNNAE